MPSYIYKERRLLSNFAIVGISQILNLAIPLLLTPYFVTVFGIERFGVFALCQTIMVYLYVIVDYNFSLIAVKDLSINRNKNIYIRKAFNQIFYTRIVLSLISFCVLLILVVVYPLLREHLIVVMLSFSIVWGQMFLPNWFLQGMEQLKLLSLLNFTSKLIYICLVFILVKSKDDYYIPNLILGCSSFIVGIISLFFLKRKYALSFRLPYYKSIMVHLKSGFRIFCSNLSISVYSNANVFIIGLFYSPVLLGYYTVVDRVISLFRSVLGIFFQVTFPRISYLAINEGNKIKSLIKRIYVPIGAIVLATCLCLFYFSKPVATYFLKNGDIHFTSTLLKAYCIVPFIVFLNIPFYQLLLIHNHSKIYSNTLIIAGGILLSVAFIFIPLWGLWGAIASIILTEIIVTSVLLYFAYFKFKLI